MSEETRREWKTTGKVVDLERRATWLEIFGRDEIPLRSPMAEWVRVPEFEEPQRCYWLDLGAISDDERARLVESMAKRFGLAPELVDEYLDDEGMAVRAEGVVMATSDFGILMDMMDMMGANDWEWVEVDDGDG